MGDMFKIKKLKIYLDTSIIGYLYQETQPEKMMEEIWKVKKNLSEKFWGKSANEINNIIKPNVDDMKFKIDELRKKKEKKRIV